MIGSSIRDSSLNDRRIRDCVAWGRVSGDVTTWERLVEKALEKTRIGNESALSEAAEPQSLYSGLAALIMGESKNRRRKG